MRRLELHVRDGEAFETALKAVRKMDPVDFHILLPEQQDRKIISVFLRDNTSQTLVDILQQALKDEKDWRLVVMPIEATLPKIEEVAKDPKKAKQKKSNQNALREELLHDIEEGAQLDRDFLIMVFLSTVVAAIGLNSNSIAGVIGAMVIAPLLGPILGFSMGAALGSMDLIRRSSLTLLAGISLALVSAYALSFVMPLDLYSRELISRAEVRLDGVALSLAAGGAAALSLARGQGSTLVGVMVAAALLPPGAATGLFLGGGHFDLASRAGLLLTLNVAALVLSALLVFRVKGIRPLTWVEQKAATKATRINALAWIVFLLIAAFLIVYLDLGATVEIG
ncbi:MAG: TIGR00341 family protein [Pseudomonadota bacterium]